MNTHGLQPTLTSRRVTILALTLIAATVLAAPAFAQNTYPWPASGRIGIGTSSPTVGQLQVFGGSSFTTIPPYGTAAVGFINSTTGWGGSGFLFTNASAGSKAFSMVMNNDIAYFGGLDAASQAPWLTMTATGVTVWGSGTSTFNGNVSVGGNVTVTGNIAAKYQDVAEWVPTTTPLEPGTVVVLNPEKSNEVMASNFAYDTGVAGVVSAQPGVILGEPSTSKEMIATTGRVMVRVRTTNGPIKIGDLLVASTEPGVAMKSEPIDVGGTKIHRPGTIIGKALQPLAEGKGEILVLLTLQ